MQPNERRAKAKEAQKIDVTVHVGKGGVTDALLEELNAQLRNRKLVKVRLLPSSEGGKEMAEAIGDACDGELVDVRGHTAVYWKR